MLKKVKVLMLPSKEKALIVKDEKQDFLFLNKDNYNVPFQDLYFLSDEEIQLNDPYYNKTSNKVYIKTGDELYEGENIKVIASTNPKCNVPKPSNSFIEKYIKLYNENKQIEWVNVEYEEDYDLKYSFDGFTEVCKRIDYPDILKVDKSNEITIKPIKDSWNRKEVEQLCFQAYYEHKCKDGKIKPSDIDELYNEFKSWLDKNI